MRAKRRQWRSIRSSLKKPKWENGSAKRWAEKKKQALRKHKWLIKDNQ